MDTQGFACNWFSQCGSGVSERDFTFQVASGTETIGSLTVLHLSQVSQAGPSVLFQQY